MSEAQKVTPENLRDQVAALLGIPKTGHSGNGKRVGTDEIVIFNKPTEQKFKVKIEELKEV